MAYEQKDNEGTLFRNKKQKTDKHPTHTGSGMINGVEYWIDAWTNTAEKTGEKYFKFKFKPKEEQQSPAESPQPSPTDGIDDTVPF